MARATKPKQPELRLSTQVNRALREGALYVFGALAFILWFAPFTYDRAAPGFRCVPRAQRPLTFATEVYSRASTKSGGEAE